MSTTYGMRKEQARRHREAADPRFEQNRLAAMLTEEQNNFRRYREAVIAALRTVADDSEEMRLLTAIADNYSNSSFTTAGGAE